MFFIASFLDSATIQDVVSHPVHVLNDKGDLSPSAFIPFCEFGGNMSLLGVRNNNFKFPVCSAFRKKIVQGALCYQVDINNFKKEFTVSELRRGLTFLLDNNDDRQLSETVAEDAHPMNTHNNMVDKFLDFGDHHKAMIHIDTISGDNFFKIELHFLCLAPVMQYGGGNFALKNLKEIKVTSSFLGEAEDIRKCEGSQTFVECSEEVHKVFLKKIIGTCQCVPLNIKDFNQAGSNVNTNSF